MMELKFRAWHKEYKEYYEVGKIDWDDGFVFLHSEYDSGRYDFDEVILEQFTGEHDVNGRELYIGDIIKIVYTDDCYIPEEISYLTCLSDLMDLTRRRGDYIKYIELYRDVTAPSWRYL